MSVTAQALKTVSFKSPYIGDTFQELADSLLGRSGYLAGGETSDNGSIITVQPFKFVADGLVVETETATGAIAVPTAAEPWFLLAAVPDDDPATGVLLSVTSSLVEAGNGNIIAFKVNGSWQNPRGVGVLGASQGAPETGVEEGFETRQGFDGGGNLNQLDIEIGKLVDPDDARRILGPQASESAKTADAQPYLAHEEYVRADFAVLRQLESFSPAIEVLRGPTYPVGVAFTPEITIATGANVTRPHYHARKNGTLGQQWWAWGDSTALRILGGPAGEAFAATTLLTGSGNVTHTWIAGQRTSDDAVILLYIDSGNLRMVSFDPATGAKIDTELTIDTQAGVIVRPRGVIDTAEKLHVVFEHTEGGGPPTQQIYYTKVDIAVATFGTHAVTPRIIDGGSHTGKNDTWASVAVDRYGLVHVAYITGTGTNEYGDFVYAILDQGGVTDSVSTHLVGSAAGEDNGTSGFVAKSFDDFRRPSIVVTPHDEVYAAVLGTSTATGNVDATLLFGTDFEDRLRFALVQVEAPAGADDTSCAMTVTDQGALIIFTAGGTTPFYNFELVVLDSVIAPYGRLDETVLYTNLFKSASIGTPLDGDINVAIGPVGEVVPTWLQSTTSRSSREHVLYSGYQRITPHPRDIYLKEYQVAGKTGGAGEIPVEDGDMNSTFEIFNVRPKKMNYPILVGNEGDYQGYGLVREAVAAAQRVGGEIVLRAGRHLIKDSISLYGGMSLRGDGLAYLDVQGVLGTGGIVIIVGTSMNGTGLVITGNLVESTSTLTGIQPGDLVELTSGFHRVLKVFEPGATYKTRLLLDDQSDGTAPSGTSMAVFPAGIRIENLTINTGMRAASGLYVIKMVRSFNARISNINFIGEHTNTGSNPGAPVSFTTKNIMPLVEHIDFTQFEAPDDHFAIELGAVSTIVESPMVRFIRLKDGGPAIHISNACENPMFAHIHSDNSDAAQQIFELEAGRTTPIHVVNCEGRFSGAAADLAYLTTQVGQRIRQPELGTATDDRTLEFEDGVTRASAITDDAIKLANATNKEFNGATDDVITAAVNERVLKAGDTMTGNLVPNATGLDLGSVGARFDAFLEKVTIYDNLLPSTTGKEIGASAGNRFNIFANTLNVLSTSEFTGAILGNFIPNVTAQDIGSIGARWDAFLEDVITYRSLYVDARTATPGAFSPLQVHSPNAHTSMVGEFKGRGGTPGGSYTTGGGIIDGFGQLQNGVDTCTFLDDFFKDIIDTDMWSEAIGGGGSIAVIDNHTVRLTAVAGFDTYLTSKAFLWGSRQDLGYYMRARLKVPVATGGFRVYVGWTGMLHFRVNSGGGNWLVETYEGAGTIRTYDTGIAQTTGWKYFVLATNDYDHVYWSISSFDGPFDGSGGGAGDITLTENFFTPAAGSDGEFRVTLQDYHGSASYTIDLDVVDVRYRRIE